jgi:cytochrome b subunit of formate dehydrogenase
MGTRYNAGETVDKLLAFACLVMFFPFWICGLFMDGPYKWAIFAHAADADVRPLFN